MKKLYIISTPYHLLISSVKTLLEHREGQDSIIIVKDAVPLEPRTNAKLIFKNVITSYNQYNVLLYTLLLKIQQSKIPLISKIAQKKENKLSTLFSNYSDIYIFDDNSYFGCWLNNAKIYYNHIEDGLNYLQFPLYKTKRMHIYELFYKFLGISWNYWGKSEYTKSIEVNENKNLRIKHSNIIEKNRKQLFEQLSPKQIDLLAKIFDYHPLNKIEIGDKTLLITDPLFEDGIMSHAKKIQIYKHIVKNYAVGKLYIKMHPREKEDYTKIFPDAIILGNQKMPFEIYQLKENFRFKKAITTFSTLINAIFCADENISMGIEWTLNFPNQSSSSK